MAVGTNGPPVLNGSAYVYPIKTLAQLRDDISARLGYAALSVSPPGVDKIINSFLRDAHTQLYTRYPTLRQQRWWSIALEQGERHYDVPMDGAYLAGDDIAIVRGSPDTITTVSGNFTTGGFTAGMRITVTGSDADDGFHTIAAGGVADKTLTLTSDSEVTGETAGNNIWIREEGALELDMRQIEYAGLLDGTKWSDMIGGIDPAMFNITSQQRPTHYEIREYIEVMPEPDKAYTLYLKGRHALRPFTADTDVTSMDPHPVFLQALAQAKSHYGQPDARLYFQMLQNMVEELNAGTYSGNEKFIPRPNSPQPSMAMPQVTYSR